MDYNELIQYQKNELPKILKKLKKEHVNVQSVIAETRRTLLNEDPQAFHSPLPEHLEENKVIETGKSQIADLKRMRYLIESGTRDIEKQLEFIEKLSSKEATA